MLTSIFLFKSLGLLPVVKENSVSTFPNKSKITKHPVKPNNAPKSILLYSIFIYILSSLFNIITIKNLYCSKYNIAKVMMIKDYCGWVIQSAL